MDKATIFKWEMPYEQMATKYLLWELNINKKFAREQKVSWEEIKKYIFDIFKQASEKNLFSSSDKTKSNYNLLDNYEDNCSLCVYRLNGNGEIIMARLLNNDNTEISDDKLEESKIKENSFIFLFNLGLVSHKDATLLKEGVKDKLWKAIPETNAGILYETPFGIVVSDKLQKVVIIKKSVSDFSTLGLPELIAYLSEKSYTYRTLDSGSENKIKITPFVKDKEFDSEDIASIFEIDLAIAPELVKEYRKKAGKNDLFFNLSKSLQKWFGNGESLGLSVRFSEEGDEDAISVFKELYASFIEIQGEEIERIFNRFKIEYEKKSGGKGFINFKINKAYRYEDVNENKPDFENIFDAFLGLRKELNGFER